MPIDPITGAKLWLAVKPIERIRKWRNKRRIRKGKEPIPEDNPMPNLLQFLQGPVSKLLAAALGFIVGKLITAVPFVATLIGVDAADPAAMAGWIDTAVEWIMTVGFTYFAPANTTKNA